jgi:hypothetical protein
VTSRGAASSSEPSEGAKDFVLSPVGTPHGSESTAWRLKSGGSVGSPRKPSQRFPLPPYLEALLMGVFPQQNQYPAARWSGQKQTFITAPHPALSKATTTSLNTTKTAIPSCLRVLIEEPKSFCGELREQEENQYPSERPRSLDAKVNLRLASLEGDL